MFSLFRKRMSRSIPAVLSLFTLVYLAVGCSPTSIYKQGIKLGVQAVGDTVQEEEMQTQSKKLVDRPPTAADNEFGPRLDTLADTRSKRVLMVYPVKDDITNSFRWVVEAEGDRIVALAKAMKNSDIGEDQVKSLVYKEMLKGKTSQEIEQKRQFRKLVLVLRRQSTGRIVRVYDLSGITDVFDARYAMIEFDKSDRFAELHLVGVPATTERSAMKRQK